MFEKSGALGQLEYHLNGPERLDPGEPLVVQANVRNPSPFPRWFRVSAIEDRGGHWLQDRGIGLVDLKGEESKSFNAVLGRLPEDMQTGEYILRVNLSTLGATEYFSYPLRVGGVPPWFWIVPAAVLIGLAAALWRRRRRRRSA